MTAEPFATPRPSAFQALSPGDPREIGGYRLSARLGAGGMGHVYLAHTPGGRPVALKVIRPELAQDPEFRYRFAQEAASARRIHGLYTAQVVDAGTDAATPWLATAFVPGPSLQQVVHRHGPLPERTVLLLLVGIAEALQAIHAAGVVHRDLKPANVLVAADGPRVIDFGIARAADAGPLTGTGLRIGSPGFMAPEQALGRPATPATDVFALGALIAYIGSGTPPFGDGPEHAALYRAVHEEPDLSRLPYGLHELVRLCLAKNPEERPSTAWLIEAARRHPATGGELRFSDGWLPQHISSELHRHTDPPATPPPATVLDPARAVADAPTAHAPAVPATHEPRSPAPARRRATTSPRRGARTALLTTAALLVGATATFLLIDSGYLDTSDAPSAAPAGSPAPSTPRPATTHGYTVPYTNVELTSPDSDYEIDLRTGKVSHETPAWYLGREAGEFYVPDDSTAYIAPDGGPLTLPDCLTGLDTQPASALPFTILRADRSFCVRAYGGQDVAVIHTLNAPSDDGPVKVSITYYRRAA
ncbi:protein kinase domain-containing protein [Streptomyces sp. NPDC003943]